MNETAPDTGFTLELPLELPEIPEPPVATLQLPDPDLLHYYQDLSDRRIYVYGEIEKDVLLYGRQILRYNYEDRDIPAKDRTPIHIHIFSPGGDLQAAYSLIAICEASITPIITINMGMAYSAAMNLLLSGHKRFCLKWSQALIHQGSGAAQGSFSELEESQKVYRKMVNQMKDYILEKTRIDNKLFNKNKMKDWYLTDEEQVSLGIVDQMVQSLSEIV